MRPPALYPSVILASWFWSGWIRPAPGTWGTLAALPFAWAIWHVFGPSALLIAAAAAFASGCWAAGRYDALSGGHDSGEIVIDEVAGVWLTLALMGLLIPEIAAYPAAVAYASGFLAFRLFDIAKPFPISWLDRRVGGGLGVMLDDIVAGLFAFAAVYAGYAVYAAMGG